MVIKMMGQHGFHEPSFPNRLNDDRIVQAKQAHVSWLPSDEKILSMSGPAFRGLRISLAAELRAIEAAKKSDWQEIDVKKTSTEHRLRVRVVQAEKLLRRAEENYRKLLNNGEHELLSTYEQERDALLSEIQQINDERNTLAARLEELTEAPRDVAIPVGVAPASEIKPPEQGTVLMERLADTILMNVGQMRTDYQADLVNRMDSEITFLRSVIERLMAK